MYKVANAIYESDVIIFFGSVRWGKLNAIYANLMERLTWIENIHNTLGEKNILKNKESKVVVVGQNFNGHNVVELEKKVLDFFGFKIFNELSFNWQFLSDSKDESQKSYKEAYDSFIKQFNFDETLKELDSSVFILKKIIREALY